MNIRRGLHRLFIVLAIGWYLWGCWYLLRAWNQYSIDRAYEMNECLKSWPEADCKLHYTSASNFTTDVAVWHETLGILLIPALVYGAGRVCAWVILGFKATA